MSGRGRSGVGNIPGTKKRRPLVEAARGVVLYALTRSASPGNIDANGEGGEWDEQDEDLHWAKRHVILLFVGSVLLYEQIEERFQQRKRAAPKAQPRARPRTETP
jgi:hypothetical protein